MKCLFPAAVGIALALTFGSASAENCVSPIPVADLVAEGQFSFATNPTLPPLQYVDKEGNLKGMSAELGYEIGKRLCLETSFVRMDLPAMFPALQAGRFDGISSANFWNEARSKAMYCVPYAIAGFNILGLPDSELKLESIEDLAGRSLAVEADSYQDHWLRKREKESIAQGKEPIRFFSFATASEALAALRAGQVEAMAIADYTGAEFVRRGIAKTLLSGQGNTQIMVSFRKKSVAEAVAKVLSEMREDGTYAKMMDQYSVTQLPSDHRFGIRGPGPGN
ncbi:transporter substrate-binding domain-containing protein [Castellaniella sp. S9]|uniref:transporter substrate-binding domain-containing protein n=1 Tax=Castellaniella sp. S9 TaxID=2993652 RepID=UPI0022B317E5|nr:transporter substrate-binding domain-containing protein [Castellaniella sp. S9]